MPSPLEANSFPHAGPVMRPAPTRSKLLAKFGAFKAENPFALEERRAVEFFAEGTSKILNMHTAAELSSLCGVLCLPVEGTNKERKDRILRVVADETMKTRNPEKAYSGMAPPEMVICLTHLL